jgi:carbonic anhydrase
VKTIDYTYRFDPSNPTAKAHPRDAGSAQRLLEEGNRTFSRWMESCRTDRPCEGEPHYVCLCNGIEGGIAKQAPFAVVVGCSDARVPTEMLFGQGFNDLFVIRVAGNVLGDVCVGSVDYALHALSDSVRVIVVLGHSGCGAVTAAVDAYLSPAKFRSKFMSPAVQLIVEKLFVAVREAASGLKAVRGTNAPNQSDYREALIETAVGTNAAQVAFDLREKVNHSGNPGIAVLYGVHNIRNHQVCMPVDPHAPRCDENAHLALAPTTAGELETLATRMADVVLAAQKRNGLAEML